MSTKRVYVVQNQHRWSDSEGKFVPKFDFTPAQEFGSLEFILGPTAGPFDPDSVLLTIHESLKDFKPEDYLLLVGNPVLIGLCVAVAAQNTGGDIRMLQWSGKSRKYLMVEASRVFDFPEE